MRSMRHALIAGCLIAGVARAGVEPCPDVRTTEWRSDLILHDPTEAAGFGSPLQTGRDWVIAADVDGDGADDIVIGAPECQLVDCFGTAGSGAFGQRRALAQIYSGRTGELIRELVSPVPSLANGSLNIGAFGTQLAAADLDGDGRAEIAVSAPFERVDLNGDQVPESNVGAVYIFDGASGDLRQRITGVETGRALGFSSAFVGDWNGDGVRDLLLSTRATFVGGQFIGQLRLYSGADWSLINAAPFVGSVVLNAVQIVNIGDTNGDGVDDAAVTIRELSSGPPLIAVVTSAALDQSHTFLASGQNGKTPAPRIGDVNGDGLADIAAWRIFFDGESFHASLEKSSALTGGLLGGFDLPASPTSPPTIVSVGDVDGDGVAEIAAGPFTFASRTIPTLVEDRAQIYSLRDGACKGSWRTLTPSGSAQVPGVLLDQTYSSMAAGDFDADGALDLVAVGVPVNDPTLPRYLRQVNIFRRPGCPEDLNGDGVVGFGDLSLLLDVFNGLADPGQLPADIDGDGRVDFNDLNRVLGRFNGDC